MKRIVFITGATSGIGRSCAEKFALNGDNLIINGRRNERLDEIKKSLEEKYNIEAFCAPFDVQNKEEVFQTINQFPEEWKSIDVLINSAGLALGRDLFDKAQIEDWKTMIKTNIDDLFNLSKAVIPL